MRTLQERISRLNVSVLPDFFLDRIVSVPSIRNLFSRIESKAAAGGGNLRGLVQTEIPGGNAGNLAFALSSLSARTTLYCVGNAIMRAVTSIQPSTCKVRVIQGQPGYTTSLEFPFKGKRVNVMLSDVGDIADFGGQKLTRNDIKNLKKSDCVALVNWSGNRKGNELARRVFRLRGRPRRLNFLDPADLQGAENRIKALVKDIIEEGLIDVVSLNENEARIMTRVLSVGLLRRSYDSRDIMKACHVLHDSLQTTIDIHTPIGSATSTNEGETWSRSFRMLGGIVTGAGDVWDAGDIIGHLLNFEDRNRLLFANACAYICVQNKKTRYPNLREVTDFLDGRIT